MKKIFLIISCLAVVWPTWSAAAPRGFAYPSRPLTLSDQESEWNIDLDTLKDWEGNFWLPELSPLSRQATDFSSSLDAFIGNPSPLAYPAGRNYHYRLDKIYRYVKSISPKAEQPVTEPSFVLAADGQTVQDFNPGQPGRLIDAYATAVNILKDLEQGQATSTIAIRTMHPQKKLEETNDLGIRELVAQGTSGFKGSPKNRRHNINVGIEKMKGLLIPPGAEFSFNHYLGPVDGENGFLPELVIKRTGTVPEFGGGLCQVSSTAFRAAMAGGFPITQRKNHAYAVQYYAPQGTDATIYPGVVDLKFINDTPGHLMIWPYLKDKDTLVFDFYGTSDGRKVSLQTPVQWDKKTDGSLKASWTREVVKNGTTTQDTFKSSYLPPALFNKREEFATSSNPTVTTTSGDTAR